MSDLEKKVYAACIGLAKVCATNSKTEETDKLILKAMHAKEFTDSLLNEIHEEKDRIVPGCKFCQSRCGNSDDAFVKMKEDTFMYRTFECCKQSNDASLVLEALARISYQMDDLEYKDIYYRIQKSIEKPGC